jgi:hypothetical protein
MTTNPVTDHLNELLAKRCSNYRIEQHPTDGRLQVLNTVTNELGEWTLENCRKLLNTGEDPTLPNLDTFESREPQYMSLPPDLCYGPPEPTQASSVMRYGDKFIRLTCVGSVIWGDVLFRMGEPRLGRVETVEEEETK